MRRPTTVERLYLDFDGFFASVEQQADPALRGRPVGVVPFNSTVHTCVIACSKEAKGFGVKNVMPVLEAQAKCPDIVLVPQKPDLYRRAHNALLSEISAIIPIDAIKSIDELTCRVLGADREAPEALGQRIKGRLKEHVGHHITCSIGFAANRQLAKIAGKINKPDGITVWHPGNMPTPLYNLSFSDIPGIGARMERRLLHAGICDVRALLNTQPKQLRQLWGNVTGERLWYALHGYDVQAQPGQRRMFGHGRVLPPSHRSLDDAYDCSRLLLVKAARRLRRHNFYAGRLWLWLDLKTIRWGRDLTLPSVQDDQACLAGLDMVWRLARVALPRRGRVVRLGVTLGDLTHAGSRQLDLFLNDDRSRRRWEALTSAMDQLNARYGETVVSIGPWQPPPGGYAGGKISYTRIPRAEDFW
ncbi:MAG: Y-family DNA polymerase [Hyphomicrobiaceae bacterium]